MHRTVTVHCSTTRRQTWALTEQACAGAGELGSEEGKGKGRGRQADRQTTELRSGLSGGAYCSFSPANQRLYLTLKFHFCENQVMLKLFQSVADFFCYWYFRYLMVTELYMVERWEQNVTSILSSNITIVLNLFVSIRLMLVQYVVGFNILKTNRLSLSL